jgi:hypothetical protein
LTSRYGATGFIVCAYGFWLSLVLLLLYLVFKGTRPSGGASAQHPRATLAMRISAILTAICAAAVIIGFGLCGSSYASVLGGDLVILGGMGVVAGLLVLGISFSFRAQ